MSRRFDQYEEKTSLSSTDLILIERDPTNTRINYKVAASNAFAWMSATLPTYANNADALAGGLVAGQLYRTATGVLMVVYTP